MQHQIESFVDFWHLTLMFEAASFADESEAEPYKNTRYRPGAMRGSQSRMYNQKNDRAWA